MANMSFLEIATEFKFQPLYGGRVPDDPKTIAFLLILNTHYITNHT